MIFAVNIHEIRGKAIVYGIMFLFFSLGFYAESGDFIFSSLFLLIFVLNFIFYFVIKFFLNKFILGEIKKELRAPPPQNIASVEKII